MVWDGHDERSPLPRGGGGHQATRRTSDADSGGSRPRIRDDVAQHAVSLSASHRDEVVRSQRPYGEEALHVGSPEAVSVFGFFNCPSMGLLSNTRPAKWSIVAFSNGVSIEDQIHKEWDPNKAGGLPIF